MKAGGVCAARNAKPLNAKPLRVGVLKGARASGEVKGGWGSWGSRRVCGRAMGLWGVVGSVGVLISGLVGSMGLSRVYHGSAAGYRPTPPPGSTRSYAGLLRV